MNKFLKNGKLEKLNILFLQLYKNLTMLPNGEKPIWETQEVMTELQIVLELRNKPF